MYKTIVLELLQQHPTLYRQLRASRSLLPMMERLAMALKTCHLSWMDQLALSRPNSEPCQIQSEALEMALAELQESLPPISLPGDSMTEPLSLDEAMAFLNRHMLTE